MKRVPTRWLLMIAVAFATVGVDQLTKHVAAASLPLGQPKTVGPLQLVYTTNNGVAYGLFSRQLPLVIAATMMIAAWFVIYFARTPHRQKLFTVAAGLLAGGTLSNFFERLISGHVTDFVKLPLTEWFNLADLALVVGICLLIASSARTTQRA